MLREGLHQFWCKIAVTSMVLMLVLVLVAIAIAGP
jgi:hypothetical protein